MYKIIIADDKIQEREYLYKFICENYSNDFTLPRVAHDGQEALALVKEIVPDLILLDIQMPKIDGLEVAAQLSRSYPNIKIILVTAYADFEYAKEAIKLGVAEYLLKPYTDGELKEVLDKGILELDQAQKYKKVQQSHLKTIDIKILDEKLIINRVIGRDIRQQLIDNYLNSVLGENFIFKCVVIFAHYIDEDNEHNMDIVKNFFKNDHLKVITDLDGKEKIILLFGEKPQDFNDLDSSIKRARRFLADTHHKEIHVGVSGFYSKGEKLSDGYDDAASFITDFSDMSVKLDFEKNKKYQEDLAMIEDVIKLNLMNKDTKAIEISLDYFTNEILMKRPLYFRKKRMMYLGYTGIKSVYDLLGAEREGHEKIISYMNNNSFNSESINDALNSTKILFRELIIKLEEISNFNNVTLIKEAKSFIHDNFTKKITLMDVAEAVNISYGYLSKCFKQVEGISFNSYLMKLRLEEAKMLIILNELSISEISYEVGINDPNYFSKCFRKEYGITPKEFLVMSIAEN